MPKSRFLIALAAGLLFRSIAFAQTDGTELPPAQLQNIIPPSPNAASLGRYGELPVGGYTGNPSISIPIYEINTGKLSLPISISYHAGGIKVEDIASWVGTGWTLNAGGAITRQVRGIADEALQGWLSSYTTIRQLMYNQLSESQKYSYLEEIENGVFDTQPDMFNYNAAGLSGSFFYDTSGNVVPVPLAKLLFEGDAGGWIIKDNAGNIYQFAMAEITNSLSVSNGTIPAPSGNQQFATAWYLARITNATNTDSIVFQYSPTFYSFTTIASQTKYVLGSYNASCPGKSPSNYTSTNEISGWRLSKIIFKGGEIIFNADTTQRLDLPGDYALDNIVIRNADSGFYRKIAFHYRYETGTAPQQIGSEKYRLFLDSMSLVDINGSIINKHKFDYYSLSGLPYRLSYDQDHWGYYNGANNGPHFVPATTLTATSGTNILVSGANRNPNPNTSQSGMLTKITYPTGGSTIFNYENHYALSPQSTYTVNNRGYISVGSQLNGPNVFYSDTFYIPACGTGGELQPNTELVHVNLSTSSCGGGNQSLECPLVYISGIDSSWNVSISTSGNTYVPPGRYIITADLSNVTDSSLFSSFYIELDWQICDPAIIGNQTLYNAMVGGHRIKSIIDYDERGNISGSRYFDYNIPGTNVSSGMLLSFPGYRGKITELHADPTQLGGTYLYNCTYITLSSGSNYPLLSTQGSYVGYAHVKELLGANGENGTTEYEYASPVTFPDIVEKEFPHPPATSFEWRRGQLLKETKKKAIGGNLFQKVQVSTKVYDELSSFAVFALKTGRRTYYFGTQGTPQYETAVFQTATGWVALTSDTVEVYDQFDSTKKVVTVNDYQYSVNNLLPNKVTTHLEMGRLQIKRIRYPLDYTVVSNSANAQHAGIKNLQLNNIINIPVETYLSRKDANGNERLVSATLTSFKPTQPFPDKLYGLEINAPIALNDFAYSYIDPNGNFVKDSRYKEQVNFNKYDAAGNLAEQFKTNDVKRSYLWDYQSMYPVAESINADSAAIAYTSFEADGTGNWTITPANRENEGATGTKSYQLSNGDITKNNLNASTAYVITYWTKNASAFTIAGTQGTPVQGRSVGDWKCFMHSIEGVSQVTISGSGLVDELRLYPKGAQMNTYTYDPLIGITSHCDVANKIVYFEYDGFGRLKLIRDQDKNILKTIDYKYQANTNQ
jgi:YD repeat-containing protein